MEPDLFIHQSAGLFTDRQTDSGNNDSVMTLSQPVGLEDGHIYVLRQTNQTNADMNRISGTCGPERIVCTSKFAELMLLLPSHGFAYGGLLPLTARISNILSIFLDHSLSVEVNI